MLVETEVIPSALCVCICVCFSMRFAKPSKATQGQRLVCKGHRDVEKEELIVGEREVCLVCTEEVQLLPMNCVTITDVVRVFGKSLTPSEACYFPRCLPMLSVHTSYLHVYK